MGREVEFVLRLDRAAVLLEYAHAIMAEREAGWRNEPASRHHPGAVLPNADMRLRQQMDVTAALVDDTATTGVAIPPVASDEHFV